jgi:hypothetical protein
MCAAAGSGEGSPADPALRHQTNAQTRGFEHLDRGGYCHGFGGSREPTPGLKTRSGAVMVESNAAWAAAQPRVRTSIWRTTARSKPSRSSVGGKIAASGVTDLAKSSNRPPVKIHGKIHPFGSKLTDRGCALAICSRPSGIVDFSASLSTVSWSATQWRRSYTS